MADQKQIIYDLEVKGLGTIKDTRDALKQVNKELENVDTSTEEGKKEFQQYAEVQAKLKNRLQDYSQSLRDTAKAQKTNENSLDGLRKKLSDLTKERNGIDLTSDRFQELQKEILSTTNRIKGIEEQAGDFRRSVGNYQKALEGASLGTGKFSQGLGNLGNVIKANPIGLLTTAVILLSDKVAALTPLLDGVNKVLTPIFTVIERIVGVIQNGLIQAFEEISRGNVVAGIKAFGAAFSDLGDEIEDAANQGQRLAEIRIAIEEGEIDLIKRQAELRKEIEANRLLAEDVTRSTDERIKAAQKALSLEEEIEKLRVENLKRQLEEANLKAAQNDTDRATQKEIAELEAQISQAEAERLSRSRELVNRINALRQEEVKNIEKKFEAIQKEKREQQEAFDEIKKFYSDVQPIQKTFEENLESNKQKVREVVQLTAQQVADANADLNTSLTATLDSFLLANELKLQLLSQGLNGFTQLTEENTIAYKALASAQAGISTYLAAANTLATSSAVAPPPFPQIAAAGIIANGLAQVARINNIGLKGSTGGGGGLPTSGISSRSETSGSSVDPRQLQDLFNSFRNAPAPVVLVSDIDRVQTRQTVKVKESSL